MRLLIAVALAGSLALGAAPVLAQAYGDAGYHFNAYGTYRRYGFNGPYTGYGTPYSLYGEAYGNYGATYGSMPGNSGAQQPYARPVHGSRSSPYSPENGDDRNDGRVKPSHRGFFSRSRFEGR